MLPRLQAEEQLASVNAASVPYLEQSERRRYLRALESATGKQEASRKATLADLQSLGLNVNPQEGSE